MVMMISLMGNVLPYGNGDVSQKSSWVIIMLLMGNDDITHG